jgi:hypothetical protein
MKYYFLDLDSEMCYDKAYFDEYIQDNQLTELEVYEAEVEIVPGYFWCMEYGTTAENGVCGKLCEEYDPANGKSGKCKHKGALYTPGQKITLKK